MATTKIRKTSARNEMDRLWQMIASLALWYGFSTASAVAIGNGSTAGKLRTNATALFNIAGSVYSKASTDDLWDLTGPTDLSAGQYQAHWLFLDSAGTASIGSGTVATSAAAALLALPALDGTKSVIGVYVAGPNTDYDAALAAQGTIYNGIAPGVRLPGKFSEGPDGVSYGRFVKPAVLELVQG